MFFFCSAVEGNGRQIKQYWLFSPLEKLLYIWLRVILCLLIHIITRSVSNVNVEILYPDCPTWHCFFHVSRFFRWALEKWSHDFCLVTVVNMFSICSTLNEIHNHHPRYIGLFIQSVAPHCLHTDKPGSWLSLSIHWIILTQHTNLMHGTSCIYTRNIALRDFKFKQRGQPATIT